MKSRIVSRLVMIGTMLTLFTACQTPPSKANKPNQPVAAIQPLAGCYTSPISGQSDDKFAEVRITESGGRYTLEFSFGYLDGHGAAPDGNGTGKLDAHGVLSFQFEDSFSNRGRGTFRTDHNGHWLLIQIDQVEEPRCLAFYGKVRMARQGKNPQE